MQDEVVLVSLFNKNQDYKKQEYIAKQYPRLAKAVYKVVLNCFPKKSFYRNLYKVELYMPNEIDRYMEQHQNDDDLTWDKIRDFIDKKGKNLQYDDMELPKKITEHCESLQKTGLKDYTSEFSHLVCNESIKIFQSVGRCSLQLKEIEKILDKKGSITDETKRNLKNIISQCKKYENKVDAFASKNKAQYLFQVPNTETLYKNLKKGRLFISLNSR